MRKKGSTTNASLRALAGQAFALLVMAAALVLAVGHARPAFADETENPEEPTYYLVTFVDEDGKTVLKDSAEYPEGTLADEIEQPETPTKESNAEYNYVFSGWKPELADVTEDVTYVATYRAIKRWYTVTFVDEDGTLLATGLYRYGTRAAYVFPPSDPEKPATDEYTYTFDGWEPEIVDVTGNATYTARYTATPIEHIKASWKRLEGGNRYGTMAAIVSEGFSSCDTAVLVTGSNYPDALVASSVAGALKCPVVLTKSNALSEQARTLLKSLGVRRVHVVGGTSAVSTAVMDDLKSKDLGITPIRSVWGTNRQLTSLNALKFAQGHGAFDGTVVVATGYNYADALSIGPWCYKTGTPILLTNKIGELSADQAKAAKDAGVTRAIIVGGASAVSEKVVAQLGLEESAVTRLAGSNRYETSKAIAQFELGEGMRMTNVAVATGENFPDALAGAALCGKNNSVLILAKNETSAGVSLVKKGVGIETGYVLGGDTVVPASLFSYLRNVTR